MTTKHTMMIAFAALSIACLPNIARADTADCEHVRSRDGTFSRYLCTLPPEDGPINCKVEDAKEGKILCNREIEIPEKKPEQPCRWRDTKYGKRVVCR